MYEAIILSVCETELPCQLPISLLFYLRDISYDVKSKVSKSSKVKEVMTTMFLFVTLYAYQPTP